MMSCAVHRGTTPPCCGEPAATFTERGQRRYVKQLHSACVHNFTGLTSCRLHHAHHLHLLPALPNLGEGKQCHLKQRKQAARMRSMRPLTMCTTPLPAKSRVPIVPPISGCFCSDAQSGLDQGIKPHHTLGKEGMRHPGSNSGGGEARPAGRPPAPAPGVTAGLPAICASCPAHAMRLPQLFSHLRCADSQPEELQSQWTITG
jgi:hypothetical protein